MASGPRIEIILYGRAGCHLCDEARAALGRIAGRICLRVTEVDIDGDDDLQRRYMFEIPVITADGVEVARAPISEGALEDALAAVVVGSSGIRGPGIERP
jgi:hypothetical protein